MTQDTIQYVLHLHTSGNEVKAIAEHTGLSYWTVLDIVTQYSR